MKKTIAKLLYGLLVFACIFNVANASMQASQLLTRYDCSVSASGSTLTIAFEVVGTSIMDEIGVNEITVQRYNGSSWVTVRTFTPSNTSGMTSQNARSHSGSVTYNITTSDTYRAVMEVFATLDGATDSRTLIAP